MKIRLAVVLVFSALLANGAEPLEQALGTAALDYAKRLEVATRELATVRAHIAEERAPLAAKMREVEESLAAIEAQFPRLQTGDAQAENLRLRRQREMDAMAKTLAYFSTMTQESLKALEAGLQPAENAIYGTKLESLRTRLEVPALATNPDAPLEVIDLLVERNRRNLGGHSLAGKALAGDNRIIEGTFSFIGPEVFFSNSRGEDAGVVRLRTGAPLPVVNLLPEWKPADAAALASGQERVVPADPTGGRALLLRQARGTLMDHIRRGGMVGYVIICLGVVASIIAVAKIFTLRRLTVDHPRATRAALEKVANDTRAEAESAIAKLQPLTQRLFNAGLAHSDKTKEAMEEHLYALVLQERMHHEKRLPLLAVIVTASPLLGLLGTVTGMVKTFTLITIYGTGNAAKLSSGISEALVTTELGLIVAIPTLIAHGYFTHRVKRNIALLESNASALVSAVETARSKTLVETERS